MIVVLADKILHDDPETRLTGFTHLVASSISNVQARNNLIASRACGGGAVRQGFCTD